MPDHNDKQIRIANLVLELERSSVVMFLRDSKKPLQLAGVRFKRDNVPSDSEEIVATVASLPEKAYPLFNQWLRKQPGATEVDAVEAVSQLRGAEKDGFKEPMRKQALAVLIAGTSSSVPDVVRQYLAEPLLAKEAAAPQVPVVKAPAPEKIPPTRPDPEINEIDDGTDEVLVWCKTLLPGGSGAFAEVVAVRRDSKWHQLDATRRRKLFPQTGDIYIQKSRNERLPSHGDFGVCGVHRQPHDEHHKNEFRTAGEWGTVYTIRSIPASAQNPDAVREWFKANGPAESSARTIYRLADGLLLRFRTVPQWATYDFSEPVDCWSRLPIVPTGHGEVVPGPLQEAENKFDCADISATVRKVVQQAHSLGTFPKFSKSDLQELGRHLKEDPSVTEQRIRRVIVALGQVVSQQELMELLVTEMFKRPEVKAAMEVRIQQAEIAHLAKKGSLIEELDRLESKKKELQKQADGLRARVDDAGQKIAKAARRAFERAVKEGEDSLGQVALFAALLGRNAVSPIPPLPAAGGTSAAASATSVDERPAMAIEHVEKSQRSLEDILAVNGAGRRGAPHLAQAVSLALSAGLAVIYKGRGASSVARATTSSVSTGTAVAINVFPGLVDPKLLKWALLTENLQTLCLLRINTSAFEAYGAAVEDLLWSRIFEAEEAGEPQLVFSMADGVTTLPLSHTLQALSLVIDLEKTLPAADVGLTRENWEEEMREHFKGHLQGRGIALRVLGRIASKMPAKVSGETLTILRDALAASLPSVEVVATNS